MSEPFLEAPLPAGFPGAGALGEVVVKDYPRARAARAAGDSFWTLLGHITKHGIAMTTPVEFALELEGDELKRVGAAVFYPRPDLGRPGRDGRVQVADRAPVRVLSFAIRGSVTGPRLRRAREAILAVGDREPAGPWRLLGYNSPRVPVRRRFWELQLPISRES